MLEMQIFDTSDVSTNRPAASKSAARCMTSVVIGQKSVTSSSAQLEQGTLRGGLARWQVKLAIEYIDANLGSKLRLDEIAKLFGLSTSHFSRAFKVSRGFSPGAYISMTRVNRAKRMIYTTREPLCQIAVDCGFADQAHLCKSFRRWLGVSPAIWRREHLTIHPQR